MKRFTSSTFLGATSNSANFFAVPIVGPSAACMSQQRSFAIFRRHTTSESRKWLNSASFSAARRSFIASSPAGASSSSSSSTATLSGEAFSASFSPMMKRVAFQSLTPAAMRSFSSTGGLLMAAEGGASASMPRPNEHLLPSPTNQKVAAWLYCCAVLVGTIIVVGGITRLTESGLSIVDWRPVTGAIPPITQEEWEAEFAKYKNFPEYKQKPDMTVEEFKQIFFWEWFHRFLARSVGMAYALPLGYFLFRGRLAKSAALKRYLGGLLLLFAAQGGMGWYMVKSGLKKELLDERKKAAVSAYRLAAHLTLALILFTGFIRIGVGLRHFPINFEGHGQLQAAARVMFVLTFCTAFSGAFVAGLRGGYLYNEGFPLMGGRVFPPMEELFLADLPPHRNFFENPVMAQTWHRVMAGITTTATIGLNIIARRTPGPMPPQVRRALMMVYGAVALQVTLGMLTIITRMHMHMAATHQSGAVFLLAMVCRLCAILGTRGIVL